MKNLVRKYEDELETLKLDEYFHGTSDVFEFHNNIILPAIYTNIDREGKTSKHVWVTTSLGSAVRYSVKASKRFGGNPIVFRVEPDWDSLAHRMDYEYICDFATILEEINE